LPASYFSDLAYLCGIREGDRRGSNLCPLLESQSEQAYIGEWLMDPKVLQGSKNEHVADSRVSSDIAPGHIFVRRMIMSKAKLCAFLLRRRSIAPIGPEVATVKRLARIIHEAEFR
jgi:hypothetical protein